MSNNIFGENSEVIENENEKRFKGTFGDNGFGADLSIDYKEDESFI